MKIDRLSALARSPARTSVGTEPRGLHPAAYAAETDPPAGRLGPTTERRRHGTDFVEGDLISNEGKKGRGFRVASSLYQLAKANKIGAAEEEAAERWYRDYVVSEGASDPQAGRSARRSDVHDIMIIRADSSARRTEVRKALGFCAETRLKMLMFDCLSFVAMGELLRLNRQEVSSQMALLLTMLAEFYAERDKSQRQTRRA